MKKIILLIAVFSFAISLLKAQSVVETVNFDNYINSTNNDLQNNFYSTGTGMSLTANPANGITGGCLVTSDTNNWGNDNAVYCSKFKGMIGTTYTASVCFKYDNTSINLSHFERPVSIWLRPSADWNHYLICTIERTGTFGQLTYGWGNSSSPTLTFQNNYWYRFSIAATFVGGVSHQIDIVSSAYDLGINGTGYPSLIGSTSGTFDDDVLIADSAISVSLNGAHWGGSIYLDNFYYQGVKSADSCLFVTGVNEVMSGNSDLHYSIQNNVLHIESENDFKNAELKIFSLSGQQLLTFKMKTASDEFDLSKLSDGLYLINIKTPERIYTSKFVVMK